MKCAVCNAPTARHDWYCFRCHLVGAALIVPKLVIGIAGKSKHGKSTVASVMQTELEAKGHTVLSIAVSDEIIADLRDKHILNKSYDRAYADTESGKWLLDKLIARGLAARNEDPDYWLNRLVKFYMSRFVKDTTVLFDVFIVNGLRFPNDLDWVKQAGGMTIRVIREGFVREATSTQDYSMDSSADEEFVDFEIRHREGQLEWLKAQAKALVGTL